MPALPYIRFHDLRHTAASLLLTSEMRLSSMLVAAEGDHFAAAFIELPSCCRGDEAVIIPGVPGCAGLLDGMAMPFGALSGRFFCLFDSNV